MEVVRVESNGIALRFKNKTAKHLWTSVERLRDELQVGKDFFQLYQLLVLTQRERGMLFVQQHGKWTFPGTYLTTFDHATESLESWCENEFGASPTNIRPFYAQTMRHEVLPEASTMCIAYRADIDQIDIEKSQQEWRWVQKRGELNDLTVAYPLIRELSDLIMQDQDD